MITIAHFELFVLRKLATHPGDILFDGSNSHFAESMSPS